MGFVYNPTDKDIEFRAGGHFYKVAPGEEKELFYTHFNVVKKRNQLAQAEGLVCFDFNPIAQKNFANSTEYRNKMIEAGLRRVVRRERENLLNETQVLRDIHESKNPNSEFDRDSLVPDFFKSKLKEAEEALKGFLESIGESPSAGLAEPKRKGRPKKVKVEGPIGELIESGSDQN